MPLNYSKWDQLEVSDDSDIEGHPNVDHKSLVRWKQRDIHEKREQRKARIAQLQAEIACNDVILPRLDKIADEVAQGGPAHFSSLVERLKTNPSPEKPPTTSPNQPTYDAMVEASLVKVWGELKDKGVDKNDDRFGDKLVKGIRDHIVEFKAHHEKIKKDLQHELDEQHKKITSDDIHAGFDSKYVPAKPAPPPLVPPTKAKKSEKKVEYEVINPKTAEPASASTKAAAAAALEAAAAADAAEDDEEDLPDMTPELKEFAKIKVRDYDTLYKFIQAHRAVVVPGASDALLVEGFSAEQRGDSKYARQCVHQSLILQYCDKLGKDGVRVFFARMLNADPRAEGVFNKDFEDTYAHMKKRAEIVRKEEAEMREKGGTESIQLVPQDPSQSIGFNVPDGPPPAELVLEGPGTEGLDIEQVRKALQMRWDVFCGFPEDFQEALKTGSLEQVNKVLGKMKVDEAEGIVQSLQMAGILSFADEGQVRDETGAEGDDEGEEDGDES